MPTYSVNVKLGLTGRQRYDQIVAEMLKERTSFERRWKSLAEYILPTRLRFTSSDVNRGDVSNNKILDTTATQAVDIARSGLLNGMASPSRPWFLLDLARSEREKSDATVQWLDTFRNRILDVLGRSNFYSSLGQFLEDELVYGTAAMAIYDDQETTIRCHVFPIGSYCIAQDSAGRVNMFCREYSLTARQMVEEFGIDQVSERVRDAYLMESYQQTFEVRQLIMPNPDRREGSPFSRHMRYKECFWEKGSDAERPGGDERLLRRSGYNEFPVVVARWERGDEDTWATRWPCLTALGDIKMLQAMRRKLINGINKMVDPALVGGPSLKNREVSLLAGQTTIEDLATAGQGLRPIHEVRLPVDQLHVVIEQVRDSVRHALYNPYFLMLLGDARSTPPTAEEVRARMREKLQVLGPVLERHSDDVFNPAIDRVSAIMLRRSMPFWVMGAEHALVPPPPQEIEEGADLKVEYVSEVAQSQRMVGLTALERHAAMAANYAQVAPDILDNIDWDELMAEHAEMNGVPPKVRRPEAQRAEMREARAAQQQAAEAVEAAPKVAGAARDLAAVDAEATRAAPVGAMRGR